MAPHLEHFLGIHKTEQILERGPFRTLPDAARSTTGLDASGRRIVLRWEEAPRRAGSEDERSRKRGATPAVGEEAISTTKATHHSLFIHFMRGGTEFENNEVEISGILSDRPRTRGGKHAHMEALLYSIQHRQCLSHNG